MKRKNTLIRQLCLMLSLFATTRLIVVFADGEFGGQTNVFPITLVSSPPEIDGVIKANEYPSDISGLINSSTHAIYPEESSVALVADAEYLYIGASIKLPDGHELTSTSNTRDDAKQLSGGDTFNAFIRTDVATDRKNFNGCFISIHPNGTIYDCVETIDWEKLNCSRLAEENFDILVKSSVVNGTWSLEARLLRKDIGLAEDAPFSFTAGFRLGFERYGVADQPIFFDHNGGFSIGVFTSLGVKLNAGNLNRGIISPTLSVVAEQGTPLTGKASCDLFIPKIKETAASMAIEKKIGERIEVETGKVLRQWESRFSAAKSPSSTVMTPTEKLDNPGMYALHLKLRADDKTLYRRLLPFAMFDPLSVKLSPIPSKNEIKAVVVCRGVEEKEWGNISIAFARSGKEYLRQEVPADRKEITHVFSMKDLAPGVYEVHVLLLDTSGREIAATRREFKKWDTPEWLKNRKGLESTKPGWVPAPWTPVVVKDGTVSVWGREYGFAKGSLISRIVSQNIPLLSSGITIQYLTGGKEEEILISQPEFPLGAQGRTTITQTGESGDFSLKAAQTVEFDGMDKLDVSIAPKKVLAVEEARLDIPLMNCEFFYERSIGTWREGQIVEHDLAAPLELWVGNDKAGLLIFLESYKGWLINSAKPRMTLQKKDGNLVLSLLIVNEPSEISEPLDFTFGIQASPVKPFFAGWRDIRPMGWGWAPPPVNLWMTSPYQWAASYCAVTPRNQSILRDLYAVARKNKQKVYPYTTPTAISTYDMITRETPFIPPPGIIPTAARSDNKAKAGKTEEYWYFAEDWNSTPVHLVPADTSGKETAEVAHCSFRSSWSDYFAYSIHTILKESEVDGFYFDLPTGLGDVRYDRSYKTKDGKLEGFVDVFPCRDLYKRLYYLFDTLRGPDRKPYILGHGAPTILPVSSFWDIAFHGEEIKPRTKFELTRMFLQKDLSGNPIPAPPTADAPRSYDAFAYRAIWGAQFGVPHMYLPQYGYVPSLKINEHSREQLSWTFPHNNLLWPAYIPSNPVYEFWDKVEIPFGMGDTEFFPYWENGVTTAPASARLSYWKKTGRGKYLVAVANWEGKMIEAEIQLPEFLMTFKTALNPETGKTVELTAPWKVTVPAHDLQVFFFDNETVLK